MQRARVLFVDDEPSITQALQRSFRREPFDIFTANDGASALAILADHPIDVVISDERMPGMPGSVFLSKVKVDYPETVRIILSGQATLEDAVRAVNQGEIYRFCLKPINAGELGITIRQAIQQKRLVTQSRRLLREFQKRSTLLDKLRGSSALLQVTTDVDGAVLLDDSDDADVDSLLREMEKALSRKR